MPFKPCVEEEPKNVSQKSYIKNLELNYKTLKLDPLIFPDTRESIKASIIIPFLCVERTDVHARVGILLGLHRNAIGQNRECLAGGPRQSGGGPRWMGALLDRQLGCADTGPYQCPQQHRAPTARAAQAAASAARPVEAPHT